LKNVLTAKALVSFSSSTRMIKFHARYRFAARRGVHRGISLVLFGHKFAAETQKALARRRRFLTRIYMSQAALNRIDNKRVRALNFHLCIRASISESGAARKKRERAKEENVVSDSRQGARLKYLHIKYSARFCAQERRARRSRLGDKPRSKGRIFHHGFSCFLSLLFYPAKVNLRVCVCVCAIAICITYLALHTPSDKHTFAPCSWLVVVCRSQSGDDDVCDNNFGIYCQPL